MTMHASAVKQDAGQSALEVLLLLEGELRSAESERALVHFICNETRRLVNYQQASFFSVGLAGRAAKMRGASHTSRIDPNAPYVRACEGLVSDHLAALADTQLLCVTVPRAVQSVLGFGILVALRSPGGDLLGVLLMLRDKPFIDAEQTLLQRLGGAYGHALSVFNSARRRAIVVARSKWLMVIVLCVVLSALFIPVPFSAMAPMEITARNPIVVTAPLDGVVDRVDVSPGAAVQAGDVLLRFNDTDLVGRKNVAERDHAVALARYRRVAQGAAASAEMRRDLAIMRAEVDLAESRMQLATETSARTVVRAAQSGIAIFSDVDEWSGRPVSTGERIMEIGDPEQLEVTIELAVSDVAVLGEATALRVFLDAAPLRAFDARMTRSTFKAEPLNDGRLAYIVKAELGTVPEELSDILRIGLRGTARVSNGTVPLGYYLVRRPLSISRQFLGW